MFFWFLVFGLLGYMVVYCIYYNWEYSDTNEFDKKARKEALNNIKQRSLDKYYVFTPINIRGLTLRNRVIKSGTFESVWYLIYFFCILCYNDILFVFEYNEIVKMDWYRNN